MPLNPRNANAQAQYLPPSPPSGLAHLAAIVGVDLRAVQVRDLFLVALATEDAGAALAAASSSEQNNLPAFAEYDHQDEYEKGVEQMPLNP
jgi:hypothetical protein